MNKLSYTTILAAAFLLLPGCSDDAAIDNGVIGESPEALVGDSEVEIKLSSNSSPLTRTAHLFEEENPGTGTSTFSTIIGRRLGVFCLASGKQMGEDSPAYVTDPDWNNKGVAGKSDVVLWGELANVTRGNLAFSEPKYYPATNWYRYDFYAYHTSATGAPAPVLSDDGKQVTITETIDGQKDIIWGKTGYQNIAGDGTDYNKYAYSARYFRRQMDDKGAITPPSLKMKHSLCRFTFTVEVGDEAARGITVSSIALLNMPQTFSMVLANNTYGLTGDELVSAQTEEGTIIPGSIDMDNRTDFNLKGYYQYKYDESKYSEVYADVKWTIPDDATVSSSHRLNGQDANWDDLSGKEIVSWPDAHILALPGLDEYTLRIALRTAEGTNLVCDQPLPFGNADGLMGSEAVPAKPGYSYNVTIKVYGPQDIGLSAELEDWKTDDTMGDISIELN